MIPTAHRLPRALAVTLAGVLTACGPDLPSFEASAPSSTTGPIINGEPCDSDRFPAAAAIVVDLDVDRGAGPETVRKVICTGALIAPDVVLTASHCIDPAALRSSLGGGEITRLVYGISFQGDLVALGEGSATTMPPDVVWSADEVRHPDYDLSRVSGAQGLGNYRDIGLMWLADTVSGVTPAAVITEEEATQVTPDTAVAIAGWGWQATELTPGTVGQKVCATSHINEVADHEMQIGSDAASARQCHGDSGGPTAMNVDSTSTPRRRIVGVTSRTYDATGCERGAVSTRVDAWLGWLDTAMRDACAEGARRWCEVPGLVPPGYFDGGEEPEPPGCGCAAVPDGSDRSEVRSPGARALLAVLLLLAGSLSRRRSHESSR